MGMAGQRLTAPARARASWSLPKDFSARQPSPELTRLFVPRDIDDVMLAVQVTFFKCGGVALGTALHHVAIDALSAFHFFQTWSAFSRDGAGDGAGAVAAALELPCHDRTLLRARSPPRVVNPDSLSVFLSLKNDPNIPVPAGADLGPRSPGPRPGAWLFLVIT
ncbi:hypothetical protein VPH35_118504 [Triticum aestivum]